MCIRNILWTFVLFSVILHINRKLNNMYWYSNFNQVILKNTFFDYGNIGAYQCMSFRRTASWFHTCLQTSVLTTRGLFSIGHHTADPVTHPPPTPRTGNVPVVCIFEFVFIVLFVLSFYISCMHEILWYLPHSLWIILLKVHLRCPKWQGVKRTHRHHEKATYWMGKDICKSYLQ